MSLEIIVPGLLTTVQDEGRFGSMALGMGESGVMDREASRRANRLAGNDGGAAVLECTLLGPTLRAREDVVCALTGADMRANVQGIPVPRDRAFVLLKGQTLTMGAATDGCRAYLAVRGGINVPLVMGSRSTNLKCRIGGLEGRALRKGDILPVGDSSGCRQQCIPEQPVSYAQQVRIRVIPGPQRDRLTAKGRKQLCSASFTVGADSDRMGIRLEGEVLEHTGTDIVSEGLVFGSIQLPANGRPIILMADHQTTGGYARIATVCTADLPVLAQLRPGARITFCEISAAKAQRLLRKAANATKM